MLSWLLACLISVCVCVCDCEDMFYAISRHSGLSELLEESVGSREAKMLLSPLPISPVQSS